jgi:hypothetical protein
MSDENLSSSLLNDALDIYEKSSLLKNEFARLWRLGGRHEEDQKCRGIEKGDSER